MVAPERREVREGSGQVWAALLAAARTRVNEAGSHGRLDVLGCGAETNYLTTGAGLGGCWDSPGEAGWWPGSGWGEKREVLARRDNGPC